MTGPASTARLLAAALCVAGLGVVRAEDGPPPAEATARALLAGGTVAEALHDGPDRLAVLGALLEAESDEGARTRALEAWAAALEATAPAAARLARTWSQADGRARAAERRRAAQAAALDVRLGAPGADAQGVVGDAQAALEGEVPAGSPAAARLWAIQATALQRLGRSEASLAAADRALVAVAGWGWDALELRVHERRAEVLRTLRRRPEALDAYLAAAGAARRAGLADAEAAALMPAVVMLDRAGQASRTRDALLRLTELQPTTSSPVKRAGNAVWLAKVEAELGHLGLAAAGFEQSLVTCERLGDKGGAQVTRQHLASVRARQGRFSEALALCDALLAKAPEHGDMTPSWMPTLAAVAVMLQLGLWERALRLTEEVRPRVEAAAKGPLSPGAPLDQADRMAADALLGLGRRAEARARLEAVLERSRAAGRVADTVGALVGLAAASRLEGAHARALSEVEAAIEAAREFPASMRAELEQSLVRVHLAAGRPEAALAAVGRALALVAQDDAQPLRIAGTIRLEAACLLALGRTPEALEALGRAADLGLALTRGLGERDAAGLRAIADDLAGAAQGALRRLAADGPEAVAARLAEVWRLREAGQALLLAEAVEHARADDAPADLAPFHAHAAALEDLARAQARARLLAGTPDKGVEALQRARLEVEQAHARVEAAAARAARARASDGVLAPAALEDVRAALGPTEAFVAYVVDPVGLGAFVVRGGEARWIDLGPAAGLADLAQAWRELVATPAGPEERLASRLHERLLAPLEPLLDGIDLLLVSPDGPLANVPLEALRGAGGERAVARRAFAYVPSATTWLALARRAAGRPRGVGFLGLADPDLGAAAATWRLPPLPGARAEVEGGAALLPGSPTRVLLGPDATRIALEAALMPTGSAPWRLVSLACHGVLDHARPRLSALVLAEGEPLHVERLERLRVPADLVVLSACDTLGGAWLPGEGLVSLVRPLLQGGASRVVASAWRVPDLGTAELLLATQRAFVGDGRPAARALAEAKRRVLAAGGARAHPYAWAPFVLWGLP